MRRSFPHLADARLPTVVWAASLLILAAYVVGFSAGRTTHGFIAYYAASRLFVTGNFGARVYDDAWFTGYVQAITSTGVLEIFGPNLPTMALLALPVVFLEPTGARIVWLAASLVGFALASAALVRCGIERDERVPAVSIALVLLSPVVFANLRSGQAYLLVFSAFTVAALCLVKHRDALAGVLIGLALMLKSSGLPLLLLLIVKRRTRAVVAAVLACVSGALLLSFTSGFEIWPRYVGYVREFLQRPGAAVTAYQTTRSLFRHLCVPDPTWNPGAAASCPTVAAIVPGVLIACAIVVTVVVAWRARTALWVAAGVCLSVLVVPVAEEHQFALLGIPLMFVVQARARNAEKGGALVWSPWVVFAVLFVVPLDDTAHRFTEGWSALAAYPRLYAAWLLWALTIRAMLRDRATDP